MAKLKKKLKRQELLCMDKDIVNLEKILEYIEKIEVYSNVDETLVCIYWSHI